MNILNIIIEPYLNIYFIIGDTSHTLFKVLLFNYNFEKNVTLHFFENPSDIRI